jgi:hypothetical protein
MILRLHEERGMCAVNRPRIALLHLCRGLAESRIAGVIVLRRVWQPVEQWQDRNGGVAALLEGVVIV